MAAARNSGAVAAGNEEAVRAWDTVLFERWKQNREVFVGALDEVTEELFDRYPPPGAGAASTSAAASARRPGGWPSWSAPRGSRSAPTPRRASSRRPAGRRARPGSPTSSSRPSDAQARGLGAGLRLRLLAHGDAVLRRAGGGDAGDPRVAEARRRAAQDLLVSQGREPALGGDRAGRAALPLAARRSTRPTPAARGRSRSATRRRSRASSRRPASRRSSWSGVTSTTSWVRTWRRRSTPCSRSARERS